MATVRTAALISRHPAAAGALLTFAITDGAELGFRGGQYIIVDTGLDLPDGKRRKRAYSLSSSDREQLRFELGVYPVAGGLGAQAMLALEPGAELRFSGPWGKLTPPADASGRSWVIATDTGITAALGLLRGQQFAPALARTTLLWATSAPDYFLTRASVQERLPAGFRCREARLPMLASPERALAIHEQLDLLLQEGAPASIYVAGDGQVPAWVRGWLEERGLHDVVLQSENFFHHPVRKAAAL